MSYSITIYFDSIEELKAKLRKLLEQIEALAPSTPSAAEIRVLCDETVRKIGSILRRVAEDQGLRIRVYEASSSVDREVEIEGVTFVPVKDDLDVLRYAKKLDAILVTGDKRLAQTAEAYGVKALYVPPSGVVSKEHYALEVVKKLKDMLQH